MAVATVGSHHVLLHPAAVPNSDRDVCLVAPFFIQGLLKRPEKNSSRFSCPLLLIQPQRGKDDGEILLHQSYGIASCGFFSACSLVCAMSFYLLDIWGSSQGLYLRGQHRTSDSGYRVS